MASEFPRGSEWRRWDLHVHTPASALYNEFQGWDSYLDAMEAADPAVSVVGVTDYASLEGYKRIRHEIDNVGRLGNFLLVVPNIEFRISPFTKTGQAINLHLLIDPKVENHVQRIEDALSRLTFTFQGQKYACREIGLRALGAAFDENIKDDVAAYREGIRQFKPDFDAFRDWLQGEKWLSQNSIVVVANSNNDGASGLNHDDGYKAKRQEIYRFCHAIFSGNPNDRNYFLGKGPDSEEQLVSKINGRKPCIHGSDAHKEEKLFRPDQDRNCWIKADPTFEGLRQILYEPEERVRIQSNAPFNDFKKPFFGKVVASGEVMGADGPKIGAIEIPLNRNLVTLIGGRGTGKSILLDCVFKAFGRTTSIDDDRLSRLHPDNVQVHYEKSDGGQIIYDASKEDQLSYLHVRQGDIRRYVTQPDELSRQIKQLLGIESTDSVPEYDFKTIDLLERILKLKAWFNQEDSEGNLINSEKHNRARASANKRLIETITTEQNKELIEQYKNNRQSVNAKEAIRKSLRELSVRSKADRQELSVMLDDVNKQDLAGRKIPSPDYTTFDNAIEEISTEIDAKIKQLRGENEEITERFREQGIDQDISGLLSKVEQYQKVIDQAEDRLQEIVSRRGSRTKLIQERSEVAEQIAQDIERQKTDVDSRFAALKQGREDWTPDQRSLVEHLLGDIDVKGEVKFDTAVFYEGLRELLNGQKFRSTNTESQLDRIRDRIGVDSYEEYLKLLRGGANYQ
jgi:hypothetical protein